jgi:hypothetical protein
MEASHVPQLPHPGRTVMVPLIAALLGAAVATATFALINIEDETSLSFVTPSAQPAPSNETATHRYDGGPQEGAAQLSIKSQPVPAGTVSSQAGAASRYDGGPQEGAAQLSIRPDAVPSGADSAQSAAGIRYDGGPEEGTSGGSTQPSAKPEGPTQPGPQP